MPTTADFLNYTQWVGIATLVFGAIAGLSFLLGWGIRFQMVGVTGFTAVLTFGLFALALVPFSHPAVPGAVHFSRIYDSGAAQVVIAVPPQLTESQLTATLQQAAGDLFSPGRLSRGENQLTIRARTVLHPEPGVSQPLMLGQIKRSLSAREDDQMEIEIYRDHLAQLPPPLTAGIDSTEGVQ
jgi:hypothetical protein